jgi:hypothetical protein
VALRLLRRQGRAQFAGKFALDVDGVVVRLWRALPGAACLSWIRWERTRLASRATQVRRLAVRHRQRKFQGVANGKGEAA